MCYTRTMLDSSNSAANRTMLTPSLRVWRTRFYGLLTVVAVAGLPAYVASSLNARFRRRHHRSCGPTSAFISCLSLWRWRLRCRRARAYGLLGLVYANGIASLARLASLAAAGSISW